MQLWVGLGNPGPQYAMHRHNVGFMAVDVIAETYSFGAVQKKFSGWAQEGRIGTEKVILLKPATFMNESGRAVSEAMRFYKLDLDALTVFHDELDLAPFKVKVKLLIPWKTQLCNLSHKRIRIKLLDIPYSRVFP